MSTPLEDVHDAIWSMLETKSDFTTPFPNGTVHQVRMVTSANYAPDPDLEEANPADYPRCRVTMQSAVPGTERNSSTSFLDVQFAIEVCTGLQHQNVLMDACWAIYRAMLGWREYVRDAVTWNSKPCIYDVDAEGIGFTNENQVRNRGTNQWIAVWSTKVRFYFATADLQQA